MTRFRLFILLTYTLWEQWREVHTNTEKCALTTTAAKNQFSTRLLRALRVCMMDDGYQPAESSFP